MRFRRARVWRIRLGVITLLMTGTVCAEDWSQYRGQTSDGSSPEAIRTNWKEHPPEVIWRKTIGPGFSSPVVSGGIVVTQEKRRVNRMDREFCVCLDAETGKERWAVDVDIADYSRLVGYNDDMDGPRSTPSIDGNQVYVLTSYLKLYCLQAENGSVVWSRDFRAELGSRIISWQNCASPLVVDDLIFLNANAPGNRLMAVRKSDGITAWNKGDDLAARGRSDTTTHATPVYSNIGGIPQVIFLAGSGLISVVPETGEILWNLSFSPSTTSTAASPLVSGERVHASAAYASGTWMARVVKNDNEFIATQLYRQRGNAYQVHWSSPVQHDGFVYTLPSPTSSQARLACLDATVGSNRWQQTIVGSSRIGYGSLIKAADTLIVLTESGELVLVEPNPEAYVEIAKFKALDSFCWNTPALSNGRLYARSTSANNPEMVVLDIANTPVPPFPIVGLAAELLSKARQSVRLTVRAQDGTDLDTGHAERLELLSTVNTDLSPDQWTPLDFSANVVNGTLVIEVPLGKEPIRYFITREVRF